MRLRQYHEKLTPLPYPTEDKRLMAIQESLSCLIRTPKFLMNVGTNTQLPHTVDASFNTESSANNVLDLNSEIERMHTGLLSAIGYLTSTLGKKANETDQEISRHSTQSNITSTNRDAQHVSTSNDVFKSFEQQVTLGITSNDKSSMSLISMTDLSYSRPVTPTNWYSSSSYTIHLDDLPSGQEYPAEHLSCISGDSETKTLIASSSLPFKVKIINIGRYDSSNELYSRILLKNACLIPDSFTVHTLYNVKSKHGT